MRRGSRLIAVGVLGCVLLTAMIAAAPALAKQKRKIEVRPGPNAISNALDRVKSGGVLRIHRGRYEEEMAIDKRVKLLGVGKRRPVIDAACATSTTIEVNADDVRLRRLKVVGAGHATEVDFSSVSGGRASDLVLKDTCDADYGINVYDAGSIDIKDSRAAGFDDAGYYVGVITGARGGTIHVRDSEAYSNLRGVIVENSPGGDIRITGNDLHHNDVTPGFAFPTGIYVTNSDGVRIEQNDVEDNLRFGLHITPDSDDNVVDSNVFRGNPVDILNEGMGNCGSGNVFTTGDPLPPC